MAGIFRGTWRGIVALVAITGMSGAAHAQAHWQSMTQPGGYGVAKVEMAGPVLGFAITCEGKIPVLAIRLARQPARSPAALRVSGATETTIALVRNGATGVWVAAVRDPALLDKVATAPVTLTIDGASGTVPNDGAAEAMRTSLAACYQPKPSTTASPIQAPTDTAVAPADATAIRDIVHQVYAWHDRGMDEKYWPPYTPSLAKMMAKCTELADRLDKAKPEASFGECNDDYDRFCQCQDYDNNNIAGTMSVALRAVRPGVVDADVKFWLFQNDHTMTPTTFRFVRTAAGWKIDDLLVANEQGKLESAERDGFAAGIADMTEQLKLPAWTPPPPETPVGS